ncbi:hypothetical protein AB6809_29515 [Paraburkholderia sp. RCC_158]|uniref:hypothetical protein n=1 Tax=Paraburkholderia sp. RCC_158 TaxID=3239220 RepID=UPI00352595DD
MKSILVSPAGSASMSTGKQNYGDSLEADFDMFSFLTNEFDNQDIRAEVVELLDSSAHLDLIRLRKQHKRLQMVARCVVARWEGGDLAAAVRNLAELVKEDA